MLRLDRITFDPHVMGGRACLRGMRITVSLIVNLVANGMTVAEIAAATGTDQQAAKSRLRYAIAKLREALSDA